MTKILYGAIGGRRAGIQSSIVSRTSGEQRG